MSERIDDHDEIVRVVQLYIDGGAEGDIGKLKEAFHDDARMFGELAGTRYDVPIGAYFDMAAAMPANGAGTFRGRVTSVQQVGDVAVATVAEDGCWGAVSFVDLFSLCRVDGTWKIVNKTFTHTGGEMPSHE